MTGVSNPRNSLSPQLTLVRPGTKDAAARAERILDEIVIEAALRDAAEAYEAELRADREARRDLR